MLASMMGHLRCRRSLLAVLAASVALGLAMVTVDPTRAEAERPRSLLMQRAVAAVPASPALPVAALPEVDPALATAATPPPPPPLPVPAGLPTPSARVPLVEIGRIQIPKIGLDDIVREGVELMVIDAGPAHWPGTASFGGWGNVVLAGHRSLKTAPFLRTGELVPGDEIVLSDASGVYTYRVTGSEIVLPTALWIVDQRPGRTLTLFTCNPIGSAAQRLVIRADLTSRSRPGA